MTTDHEGAKPIDYGAVIEWETHGHRFELMCWEYPPSDKRRLCCVTEGDLKHAGFAPLSRALAAEAEVGRLKAEFTQLSATWLDTAGTMRLEGARYETCEALEACSDEALALLASPPSPPVAPEPAQENQQSLWGVWCVGDNHPGFWRKMSHPWEDIQTTKTEATRVAAAANVFQETRRDSLGWRYEARPYPENQASSGETAGDWVTPNRLDHSLAWGMALKLKDTEHFEILNRYIAQSEATEREAARLRQLAHDKDREITAYEARWDAASRDRNAERAQKEAMRVELEAVSVKLAKMTASAEASAAIVQQTQGVHISWVHECNKLRAENEGLKARPTTREAVAQFLGDGDLAQQPTEAAPVAKPRMGSPLKSAFTPEEWAAIERPGPVAKVEAPSEPVAWVPKVGDRVRVIRTKLSEAPECIAGHTATVKYASVNSIMPGCTVAMTEALGDWEAGEQWWIDLRDLEPAPQPPATTGGAERLLGPAEALRAEIVAALRKLAMYTDADATPRHIAWQNLANELERREP